MEEINLTEFFEDEIVKEPFAANRDAVVLRVREFVAASAYSVFRDAAAEMVDEMAVATNTGEFDAVWIEFLDLADQFATNVVM